MAKKSEDLVPLRDFFDAIAEVMRDRQLTDPRHLDDVTVETIQREFGLR